jgi:hypothetical protein
MGLLIEILNIMEDLFEIDAYELMEKMMSHEKAIKNRVSYLKVRAQIISHRLHR